MMEFGGSQRVVGLKQTKRAINENSAVLVYLANDADSAIQALIENLCDKAQIPVDKGFNMLQLGSYCEIDVGAATVAILK